MVMALHTNYNNSVATIPSFELDRIKNCKEKSISSFIFPLLLRRYSLVQGCRGKKREKNTWFETVKLSGHYHQAQFQGNH